MSKRTSRSSIFRNWRNAWHKAPHTPKNRLYAYIDMLFIDHGLLRMIYSNRFRVGKQVFRSNHPTPLGVGHAARNGIKTIINLRGENDFGTNLLSSEACVKYGVKLIEFRTHSRKLPTKETINAAKVLFEEVEYPVLLHCKSGADRAGLMSALYLILHEGHPVSEAKKQLHWRYGHFRQARTGILDFFFDTYEKENAREPIDFLTWVNEKYDPATMNAAFKSRSWANTVVDSILRRE
jgi:protein tyrosine/serine phosphatase